MQISVNRESFNTMVLRLSGFEIFKFNANLDTVQWVLSVFTMVLYKKIFTGFSSFFSGSKSFGKCPNEIKLEVHPVRK